MKNKIEITEVEIVGVKPQGGLVAFASFVLNQNFYMGSIAVFAKPDGQLRLVYPKKNNINCFYPLNKVAGEHIRTVIEQKCLKILKT